MNEDLHIKYRPKTLKELVGQEHVVKSIKALISDKMPHAFLFHGPSGVGKTTLAKIIANRLGKNTEIIEIDAATHTGVDSIRELTDAVKYKPLMGNSKILVIVDEVQRLSTNAFDALLKTLEEPPDHVYFTLCTTEFTKVPRTIVTRCHDYALREVRTDELHTLVKDIAAKEGIQLTGDILHYIAKASDGSPRQALVLLSKARNCESKEEVEALANSAVESAEVIQLCRLIVQGGKWKQCAQVLKGLKSQNPESTRIVIANYLTSCVLTAKTDRECLQFLHQLQAFSSMARGFYDIVLSTAEALGMGE